MNAIIREVEKEMLKETRDFRVGDSVRISMEIVEGDKKRVQIYEGLIMSKKGTGINACITVRKTTAGIGIEKIIPIHMPSIKAIEVVRRGKVRRAKLYYLRELTGKATRVKENLEMQKNDRAVKVKA
ncbi:MAG: 50S ribosomal protein L19 [Fibrobacterota bacterium]